METDIDGSDRINNSCNNNYSISSGNMMDQMDLPESPRLMKGDHPKPDEGHPVHLYSRQKEFKNCGGHLRPSKFWLIREVAPDQVVDIPRDQRDDTDPEPETKSKNET